MKVLTCLTFLALVVAFVSCHPALDESSIGETLEDVDVNAAVDVNEQADGGLTRQVRSFGRRFCCGGGGFRRPYHGGGGFRRPYGGGGGFGGGFAGASASASASSFGGGFGYGK